MSVIAERYERQIGEDYTLLKDLKTPKTRDIETA